MKPQLILKLNSMTAEKDDFLVCGTLTYFFVPQAIISTQPFRSVV